jgi:hypothetical protein
VGRKPERHTVRRRTATASQANGPGQVAPHTAAPGSGPGGKAAGWQVPVACVSGEPSRPGTPRRGSGTPRNRRVEAGGVSSGHRTAVAKAGRPEPGRGDSPPAPQSATQTPDGRVEGPEASAGTQGGPQATLLERMRSRDNMRRAWQRVTVNQGAAGMDGMAIGTFPACARHHGERRRAARDTGPSRPAAVRRVMLPKATGRGSARWACPPGSTT